jgi:hypothetical protein
VWVCAAAAGSATLNRRLPIGAANKVQPQGWTFCFSCFGASAPGTRCSVYSRRGVLGDSAASCLLSLGEVEVVTFVGKTGERLLLAGGLGLGVVRCPPHVVRYGGRILGCDVGRSGGCLGLAAGLGLGVVRRPPHVVLYGGRIVGYDVGRSGGCLGLAGGLGLGVVRRALLTSCATTLGGVEGAWYWPVALVWESCAALLTSCSTVGGL